jgi:uncharacterized protein (TIGR03437 family)
LTLNGASIAVVVNGVTTRPALYYTSPTQLAAVLPASTPIGVGALTVTYKGNTSAPAPIQVVPYALGINTYNTNTGVATDAATGALLTYTNSGSPGETILLWTTGLGADPADGDTLFAAMPHSVDSPLRIYIGGVLATILYQGSSGYPGVSQINLTIPVSVPAGCWVPVAAVSGAILSNVVTLPIHSGGGACIDSVSGLTGDQISPAGAQALRTGLVTLVQTNSPGSGGTRTITNSANAAFLKYTGLYTPGNSLSPGGCIVAQSIKAAPLPAVTGLDVGTITFTGPSGLAITLPSQGFAGAFGAMLAAGIPQTGGTFTFKGSGGADVGAFTSTINLSNPLLNWTNQSAAATVDRTQGLTVTWNGGNPGTNVFIIGSSSSNALGYGAFTCLAPADAGKFTVPAYILSVLPPGTSGFLQVQNAIQLPLSASGIDLGLAVASLSYSITATFK